MLRVNLTDGKVSTEALNEDWARQFIGGKGLAARYLAELLQPGVDPLSPKNVLIFMTGPLTGSIASTMSRIAVVTKSPATGTFLDSYAGGYFPAELKLAGFDGIIVEGRAPRLSMLSVKDGQAEITDASHLKGRGNFEVNEVIRSDLGDANVRIASIGQAGENLVKFANIAFDARHFAGRGGSGAVMGAKNLKAIVVRGVEKPQRPNERFAKVVRKVIKEDIKQNSRVEWAIKDGTPAVLDACNATGILPTRNFTSGVFEGAEQINSDSIKETILNKHMSTCFTCSIGCRNVVEVKTGRFKGVKGEGPEYETLSVAGSNCGISDLPAITLFNEECSNYGLDTISAGNVIAWAMELFERGLLDRDQTGGLNLTFGDTDAYLEMPKLIALRQGIGDILAEGVRGASKRIGKGSELLTLEVKGLEYPGYDPRGSVAMALAYAVSDRGACHMRAWPVRYEAFGKLDRFSPDGKAEITFKDHVERAVRWSLCACEFGDFQPDVMAELLSSALEKTVTVADLTAIGRRIWTLTRMLNVREGFGRKDDTVPLRVLNDPLKGGVTSGRTLRREDFEKMLSEYYSIAGWDEQGVPTEKTLAEVGLLDLFQSFPLAKS